MVLQLYLVMSSIEGGPAKVKPHLFLHAKAATAFSAS